VWRRLVEALVRKLDQIKGSSGPRGKVVGSKKFGKEMFAEVARRSFVAADALVLDLNEWWRRKE